MLRYIIKRLITGLILLFIYVSVLFFAVQIILPGDFVSQFSLSLSPSQAEELRELLGLDLPLWQRYLNWLGNLARGNLGVEFSPFGVGQPVLEVIKSTLPITLLIFGLGTAMAFIIGQWLGRVAAWRGPGLVSGSISFVSIALYTSFPPWLAFLVVHFVGFRLGIPLQLGQRPTFRTPGMSEAGVITQMLIGLIVIALVIAALNTLLRRTRRWSLPGWLSLILLVMGWAGTWALLGIQNEALQIMRLAAVPTLLYTLLAFGEVMLIMRTSMADILHEDYIQTARAKGLPDHQVRDRHAARNAMLPVMSRLVISLPFLLSGMVMIEQVLSVQGIGTTLFYAVGMQNVTLGLGIIIVIGLVSILARLVLDILTAVLDPRIRVSA